MVKQFKAITDRPSDRKALAKIASSTKSPISTEKSIEDNPPFLEFDHNNFVVINYFDEKAQQYLVVQTTLNKNDAGALSNKELNQIAKALLTNKFSEIKDNYQIGSVVIPQKGTYQIKGNSSIKKIEVAIHASITDDETALHYLLTKVREAL